MPAALRLNELPPCGDTNHRAGVVLCGGASRRMGRAKWSLPFGGETMLDRVVRLLSEVCRPIVVVAAHDEPIPVVAHDVLLVRDSAGGRGPLEGLAVGLAVAAEHAESAFATGCDAPLLVPAFVSRMFDLLGEQAVAVPKHEGQVHPLCAVYRTSLGEVMRTLVETKGLGPRALFDIVPTRFVDPRELQDADPELLSLRNVNDPGDYAQALADAGLE